MQELDNLKGEITLLKECLAELYNASNNICDMMDYGLVVGNKWEVLGAATDKAGRILSRKDLQHDL